MNDWINTWFYFLIGFLAGYLWRYLTAKKKDTNHAPFNEDAEKLRQEITGIKQKMRAAELRNSPLRIGDAVKLDMSDRLSILVRDSEHIESTDEPFTYYGCGKERYPNLCTYDFGNGGRYEEELLAKIVSKTNIYNVPLRCLIKAETETK